MRIFGFAMLVLILIALIFISVQLHKGNTLMFCIVRPTQVKNTSILEASPEQESVSKIIPSFDLGLFTGRK